MKKLLGALLVVLCLTVADAGAGEKYRIALVTKAMDAEFWLDMRRGGNDAANKLGNVNLSVMAPDREVNVQQQVQLVEDMLSQGLDGLVIAPCGSAELKPIMQRAVDEGVPVILVDTDADWDAKTAYVGTNNRLGGQMAGERIAKSLNGKGNIALVTGIMGHQTHIDRLAGCKEVLAKYPGIKIVAEQPANSQRDLAMTVTENILTSNPDLDFVFATAATMAMGAYEAIQADGSKCKLVGFDADTEVLRLIKQGQVDSLVAQGPYDMGRIGVESMVKVLQGEKLPKLIDVPTALVTIENVAQYLKE